MSTLVVAVVVVAAAICVTTICVRWILSLRSGLGELFGSRPWFVAFPGICLGLPLLGLVFVPTAPILVRIFGGVIGLALGPLGILALPYALARTWLRSVWLASAAFIPLGAWAYLGIGTSVPASATGFAILYGFFAWWLISALCIGYFVSPRLGGHGRA